MFLDFFGAFWLLKSRISVGIRDFRSCVRAGTSMVFLEFFRVFWLLKSRILILIGDLENELYGVRCIFLRRFVTSDLSFHWRGGPALRARDSGAATPISSMLQRYLLLKFY